MIKPNYYYNSVKDITMQDIVSLNKSYCLIDLDNTLSIFNHEGLEDFGIKFINDLKSNNINVIILSNNHNRRVSIALNGLDVRYIANAFKPFKAKTSKFLEKNNLDVKDGLLIGDQLYTDIKLANKINMDSILLEPLVKKDLIITKLNRHRDLKLRKKLKIEGLLKSINGK